MHAGGRTHIEWTALLLGAALAALAVGGWQVQGGIDVPPAEVTLVAAPSGELALTPPGGTATSGKLRASEPSDGLAHRTTVQNATGGPLLASLRARPATAELDRTLHVRVSAKGEILFDGMLGELREGTPGSVELASHESAEVTVLAWIAPAAAEELWRGRVADVELTYVTRAD
jgi:hypothetical protein